MIYLFNPVGIKSEYGRLIRTILHCGPLAIYNVD